MRYKCIVNPALTVTVQYQLIKPDDIYVIDLYASSAIFANWFNRRHTISTYKATKSERQMFMLHYITKSTQASLLLFYD